MTGEPLAPQRVDIDGGGELLPGREPITGPVGVVLCGGGGGAVEVGFGGVVDCGWVGTSGLVAEAEVCVDDDADEACESLIAPPLGRSPGDVSPGASGSPLGRSVSEEPVAPAAVEEIAALFVSGPGGWPAVLLQAAQTRAAATAVAAALAGATVPRIGMDATVAK